MVLIDANETWAAGLARALRKRHPDVKVLILADPARLHGYIVFDYERFIDNAGEHQVLDAIRAAAAGLPFVAP